MKKIVLLFILFFSYPSWALVAPEIYMVDKTCPKDSPFKLAVWHYNNGNGYYTPIESGTCISCDTTKGLMLSDEKECGVCPNRTTQGINDIISKTQCRLKKCPSDKPFYEEKWNWSGCKACEDMPTHITKEECSKCSNMRWVAEMKLCAPNKKGVIYYNGESLDHGHLVGGMLPYAYACDNHRNEVAIRAGKEECAQCPHTTFKDGWCYFNQKGK